MQLDIDFAQQSSADDLPDQAKNQVLPHLNNVAAANVDHGAPDTFRRLNDNVVVLRHLEGVERLGLPASHVQHTLVDGVGHAVVDELGQNEAVLALVEHLERVGGEREAGANIRVAGKDGVDVAGELGALVLVDGVGGISVRPLDVDLAADTSFGDVAAGSLSDDAGW